MENIEDMQFAAEELAIMTLRSWAKEHGKKPTQEELEECIEECWDVTGEMWYGIINYLDDIEEDDEDFDDDVQKRR
jgi:hypothetical protein